MQQQISKTNICLLFNTNINTNTITKVELSKSMKMNLWEICIKYQMKWAISQTTKAQLKPSAMSHQKQWSRQLIKAINWRNQDIKDMTNKQMHYHSDQRIPKTFSKSIKIQLNHHKKSKSTLSLKKTNLKIMNKITQKTMKNKSKKLLKHRWTVKTKRKIQKHWLGNKNIWKMKICNWTMKCQNKKKLKKSAHNKPNTFISYQLNNNKNNNISLPIQSFRIHHHQSFHS
jgi:hypothetical protein